jgi:hypothetical protein
VTANEIQLERADFVAGDPYVREFAKASVNAIHSRVARDDIVYDFARRQNARARRSRDLHWFAAVGNGGNLLE